MSGKRDCMNFVISAPEVGAESERSIACPCLPGIAGILLKTKKDSGQAGMTENG
jgi:hypothetical protein